MGRIAACGKPGAGKSTFCLMLREEFARIDCEVKVFKLAAPLYELQATIHQYAGVPLLESDQQDGQLLNFLGSHLRKLNASVLVDNFIDRVDRYCALHPESIILCDDMRGTDTRALVEAGFRIVEVVAPEKLRRDRKFGRGDLSAGNDNHETEAALVETPRTRVLNEGTMEELRCEAASYVEGVMT
jgi:dephospho-CoA kinase